MAEIAPKEKLWNSNYLKVWCANFMIFFSFMLLTPLLPLYLSETFGADKQMIGIVLSGYTLTALIIRPFSGYLVDSFPRKVVLLVSYGLFCAFFLGYIAAGSLVLFAIVRTLHGAPFGASTVSNSTVAIDVLHPQRRAEGIGYYGLSNNIATAIGPTVALMLYGAWQSYDVLFWMAFLVSAAGLIINYTLELKKRERVQLKRPVSLDRFILLKGWSQGLCMICYSFAYGVLSTYIAIYSKDQFGMAEGAGMFFMLLAIGLILSRLVGGRTLRQGKIVQNATVGLAISVVAYFLFAASHTKFAFYASALIIGLGNGHMFPAFQTMFINLASNDQRGTANSTLLVSWDIGIGLGMLVGGSVAEHIDYYAAFWVAFAVKLAGVLFFYIFSRQNFLKNRLR
ncbi:MAG: MFS transporter [Bacteroidales bacterium]|nr:MFS transporter [Bacteroidales bacterium]